MEGELNEGNVVQLKSGGPKMTVKGLNTQQGWFCHWFVSGELKEGFFFTKELILLEE